MSLYLRPILFFVFLFSTFSLHAQNTPMPDWSLTDESGQQFEAGDFKNKPLVIHFWATWCPYCKKLQPGLESLKQKYASQGVEFIAISFWEDEGVSPQTHLTQRGITIPTLIKGDSVARELFGVEGTPTTIFVDHKGIIVGSTRTSDPENPLLEKATRYLLDEYLAVK